VEKGLVLAPRDLQRLLLEGVERGAADDEADQVPRRADGQLAEDDLVAAPGGEGLLPRERQQGLAGLPEAEAGEGALAQRRFRR
jgi:hypothetical protein